MAVKEPETPKPKPEDAPTWVYGKDGSSKIVTKKEADELIKSGDWADTPAKFPRKEAEPENKDALIGALRDELAAEKKARQEAESSLNAANSQLEKAPQGPFKVGDTVELGGARFSLGEPPKPAPDPVAAGGGSKKAGK